MNLTNVRLETEDAVGILTIDRPKSLNALDADTLRELGHVLAEVRAAAALRALVLTGAGEKAFIAGADIAAMSALGPVAGRDFARVGQRVTSAIEDLPIPVVAAVNGFALGGGCEMALACDFVIASSKARFGQPEINLGIVPGFGGTQRLARRIGAPRAREMIYGGEMIDAETAHAWGLVNRVVAPEDLLPEARKTARKLAEKPPIALGQAKLAIQASENVDLETGLRFEAEAFALTFATDDRAEGMRAFLEKRAAKFSGR